MSQIYTTGSQGEHLVAEFLTRQGRDVRPSDTKTFDLIVDDQYAEVKSTCGAYANLGFIGLTDNQFRALREGQQFTVFIACNIDEPERLEVVEIPASRLAAEKPTMACTYYWYKSQLDKALQVPG